MFLGLRTAVYPVSDIVAAKAWYASALGIQPYFDQSCYVGFNVGGYELGLDPMASAAQQQPAGNAYWGVAQIEPALARLLELGATKVSDIVDVGEEIKVASVRDPFGNLFGLIENPHFKAT
jgi:predicted enzyme related to lactoylglutathione lyase